jgi:hypothetical protein
MEFVPYQPHLNGCHAYLLNLGQINIVFGGGFNLSSLLHFKPTQRFSEPYKKVNQEEIEQEQLLLKGPVKLDLSYLLALNISEIDIFVLSSFQDIFIVPYLTNHPHFDGEIVTTHLIADMAPHIYNDFYSLVQDRDRQVYDFYQE